MPLKKKKIKKKRKTTGLAKIATFTTSSISSALSNYKKNKELNKIKAIKLQKLEERNSLQKEKKELKLWEDRLNKESNKIKLNEDELRIREKEIKYDVINCFMGDNLKYLHETNNKIIIMDKFMRTENGKNLKSLWFRVSNILNTERKIQKKIDISEFEVDSSFEKEEMKLLEKIKEVKSSKNFLKMLKQRALLKKPTDDFFENLQINDPNPDIKKRRVIILSFLKKRLLEIGNLEALEG